MKRSNEEMTNDSPNTPSKKKQAVRHAEKRRPASCRFANRVAELAIQYYRETVPESFRETQKQTCLACIIAQERLPLAVEKDASDEGDDERIPNDRLTILGLGVGTKFLSEATLQQRPKFDSEESYGDRVRDCHAEVLARRAFRRHGSLEMKRLLAHAQSTTDESPIDSILECVQSLESTTSRKFSFRLRPGITLHLYTSSAPCGNACMKKFGSLQPVSYRQELAPETWPDGKHVPMPGHAVAQGQFALLVKKDASMHVVDEASDPKTVGTSGESKNSSPSARRRVDPNVSKKACPTTWPANTSDVWCPPGTTTVHTNRGSLHTCSDKIARWNCLGLQGSLLASLLQNEPGDDDDSPLLYLSTVTVGRKLTPVMCRRAFCCRLGRADKKKGRGHSSLPSPYSLHHPQVLGTFVYMDDSGVIDMSSAERVSGQDVRFHSTLSWAWWPDLQQTAECVDGATGWAILPDDGGRYSDDCRSVRSMVSTTALLDLYLEIDGVVQGQAVQDQVGATVNAATKTPPITLDELRDLKRLVSRLHEDAKEHLFTNHPVMQHWQRREQQCSVKEKL